MNFTGSTTIVSSLDDENDIVKGIFNNDIDHVKNSLANGDNVNACDFERRFVYFQRLLNMQMKKYVICYLIS